MVRVLFASVAKNISQYFKNIKESFELFCDHEPASQMLVIESQSEDDSKSLLLDWMVKDNRVNVYHDTFTFDEIKREMCIRTIKNQNFKQEEIARCRNILLQHIHDQQYEKVEYVIMFDWNIFTLLPVQKLYNCLTCKTLDFDALISFKVDDTQSMSDKYSFRDSKFPFGPEIIGGIYSKTDYQLQIDEHLDGFYETNIPVISGFNMLTIFRKSVLHDLNYSVIPTRYLDALYRERCDDFIMPTTFDVNGSPLGMFIFNEQDNPLFYYFNMSCNFPVCNMHVNFFLQLRNNGCHKIFMSKDLVW